jgi:gamma-glutamyltranspeptidase
MPRIVMKFGGTSMAGIERIRHVASLVKREAAAGNQVAVVVSAMAGETDRLVQLCREVASLYDPATGTFTATGAPGTSRLQHRATLLATGKVLITGGYGPPVFDYLDTAELYDPHVGVAVFSEFSAYPMSSGGGDVPFRLDQQLTADLDEAWAAMKDVSIIWGGNVDWPEASIEAIHQAVTGDGYDLDCNGTYSASEDVLPFLSAKDDPFGGKGGQALLVRWESSRRVLLPNYDPRRPQSWSAPVPGQIFKQPELLATLAKLVESERAALKAGKNRKQAIMAAYDRFYRGDIAREIVGSMQEAGGLFTMEDLDRYQVYVEDPAVTNYKGIDVYKLNHWVQGPVMLQTLNLLENVDLRSMGYNSARYIHTLYQAMNLAYADRDFYYGDPYVPPVEPIKGLMSKEYARKRFAEINWEQNDALVRPGDPYPFQGATNPFHDLLENWRPRISDRRHAANEPEFTMTHDQAFLAGTTSMQAADKDGWVVSITPSGGWVPAFIAGNTGVGLSQRMQSFVLDPAQNPYNVLAPGKRPRATLSPSMALKDGKPFLSFAVQGGDAQDQNLLQFFLNIVEFKMSVQQAVEAANVNSYQMQNSFGDHTSEPGRLVVRNDLPPWVKAELQRMGYRLEGWERTALAIVTVEPSYANEPKALAEALPTARSQALMDRVAAQADADQLACLDRPSGNGAAPGLVAIRRGDVVAQVLAAVEAAGADVLAVGYHRGGPPGSIEGGSIARRLAHQAPCAFLAVPL